MKLKTSFSVNVTTEEAQKLLTRFVEKKSNKKVISASFSEGTGFTFSLLEEEADLDQPTKEQGA